MKGVEEELIRQARQHGIPEREVLKAWEEIRNKHHLPFYVEATLETSLLDGSIMLQPAVNINLLSRVEREVPGFLTITGPVWPGKVVPELATEVEALLAKTEEGSPLRKSCCRQCGECVPKELLEKGRLKDRLSWLKTHYQAKHPSMWGKLSPMAKQEGVLQCKAWKQVGGKTTTCPDPALPGEDYCAFHLATVRRLMKSGKGYDRLLEELR